MGRILAQTPSMSIASATPLADGRILFVRADHPYFNAGRAVWEVKTNPQTGAFGEDPRKIAEMENRAALQSLSTSADGRRIMVVKRSDQSTMFVADFDRSPPRFTNTAASFSTNGSTIRIRGRGMAAPSHSSRIATAISISSGNTSIGERPKRS